MPPESAGEVDHEYRASTIATRGPLIARLTRSFVVLVYLLKAYKNNRTHGLIAVGRLEVTPGVCTLEAVRFLFHKRCIDERSKYQ